VKASHGSVTGSFTAPADAIFRDFYQDARSGKFGAKAVGVGRPYAYGLALGGVDGVVHVLRCLLAEADLLMAVDGYPTLVDLTPEALMRV